MGRREGKKTLKFDAPPSIAAFAAVGGKKEGKGPLGGCFDFVYQDDSLGQSSWERAEVALQKEALQRSLDKAGTSKGEVDMIFAGDLTNQCIASAYGQRETDRPFFGLYGACSTMSEGMILAAMAIESGLARRAAALASSHFCTAERQFRMPLEYGGQRAPSAQWTATAAGAVLLEACGKGPYLTRACAGSIVDFGVRDMGNMGAAMAPAAFCTLFDFFSDTGSRPEEYDRIISGDLGRIGSEILCELFEKEGVNLAQKHSDCGCLLYDPATQDVHAGGSGCGCSAAVLCCDILPKLKDKRLGRVLFMPTGALMNNTAIQQGESIPGIAHLVELRAYLEES